MDTASHNQVLLLFAHPYLERSLINRSLLQVAHDVGGITVRDLYHFYPDYFINVEKEQNFLREHDTIILHHPLFWFSCPSLLKHWFDLVLTPSFAFGHDGNALQGKKMFHVLTVGGPEANYSKKGLHAHELSEFLLPFERTANVCGMEYFPPFAVYEARKLTESQLQQTFKSYQNFLLRIKNQTIEKKDTKKVTNFLHEFGE